MPTIVSRLKTTSGGFDESCASGDAGRTATSTTGGTWPTLRRKNLVYTLKLLAHEQLGGESCADAS